MICLTGDIHHSSLDSPEQELSDFSEVEVTYNYLKICEHYNIKATLFITGKAFIDDWQDLKGIMNFKNVEIGGHTFRALRPRLLHDYFKFFCGSYYGPYLYQWFDIKKTLSIIEKRTNQRIKCWRTHAYSSDKTTRKLLSNFGINVLTDDVNKHLYHPEPIHTNLISFPINVLPDHEHIYHADRTVPHVEAEINNGWKDSFTEKSFFIDEWFEIVVDQIQEIERHGGIATMLVHPICMYQADKFKTFEKLCRFLNSYRSQTISGALPYYYENSFRS